MQKHVILGSKLVENMQKHTFFAHFKVYFGCFWAKLCLKTVVITLFLGAFWLFLG